MRKNPERTYYRNTETASQYAVYDKSGFFLGYVFKNKWDRWATYPRIFGQTGPIRFYRNFYSRYRAMQSLRDAAESYKGGGCSAWSSDIASLGITPSGEPDHPPTAMELAWNGNNYEPCGETASKLGSRSGTEQAAQAQAPQEEMDNDAPAESAPESSDALTALIAEAVAPYVKPGIDESEVRRIADDRVDQQMKGEARKLVEKLIEEKLPKPTLVELKKPESGEVQDLGLQHHNFPKLLTACSARDKDGHRLNTYLHGPAGTGKTTAAKKVAEALNLPFHFTGAIDSEYKLNGFIDASGCFQSRPFFEAFTNGGVFLWDEIDSSLPGAVLSFMAALANGMADFPTGNTERHPDCIIIVAGNTVGRGATTEYTRQKQDAAFLDRFLYIEWDIDEDLERAMVPAEYHAWVDTVQTYRKAVVKLGLKIQITPRATVMGIALLKAGMPEKDVIDVKIRAGLSADQWGKLSAQAAQRPAG